MVQILSIIFFSWISSIFVEFFKSSRFFCVTLYLLNQSWFRHNSGALRRASSRQTLGKPPASNSGWPLYLEVEIPNEQCPQSPILCLWPRLAAIPSNVKNTGACTERVTVWFLFRQCKPRFRFLLLWWNFPEFEARLDANALLPQIIH